MNKSTAQTYKSEIQAEILKYCSELINIIDNELVAKASCAESRVFFNKMKGDYYRYMAEVTTGEEKGIYSNNAENNYAIAYHLAKNELPSTHQTRIGLALNFSVFYYEIKNEHEQACNLTKSAIDEALPNLENVPRENYNDCASIIQLMKDNLTLWSTGMTD